MNIKYEAKRLWIMSLEETKKETRVQVGVRLLIPSYADALHEWVKLENVTRHGNPDRDNVDRNDALNLALALGMETFFERMLTLRAAHDEFDRAIDQSQFESKFDK
jgi:hypothetical protein